MKQLPQQIVTLLFLTKLAQAANKPAVAERYAKQLLKLSLLKRWQQEQVASSGFQTPMQFLRSQQYAAYSPPQLMRIADVTPSPVTGKPGGPPGLAFDEEAYTLGFNIFLANRNLDDARRLAQSAVQQQPGSVLWRKRLAQVSEWSNAPQMALAQWLSYARMSGEEAAWNAALRLSESLFDQSALQAALEHKIISDPNNKVWLNRLLASYETAGEPQRAIALLRSRLEGKTLSQQERKRELELLADVSERAGLDPDLLATLLKLQAEFGPNTTYALRIAAQLYQRGKVREAFGALEQGIAGATGTDTDFWRTYAEVARLLQNDEAAETGYRKLLEANTQNESDITNLGGLMDAHRPLAAARILEFSFVKTGKTALALQVLSLRIRVADWEGARRFFATLSDAQIRELEQNPAFFSARASIAQASNDLPGAQRAMRSALALRPDDPDLRAGLIWILVAARETETLKQALTIWAHDAETSAVLWGPFAAANMSLNRQADALHWFRKSGFLRDDYLWLMSYAECLDANALPELAWRIRRRTWLDLRKPEVLTQANPELLGALRDRLGAVAPLFMSGDGAQRLIQALLRADVSALINAPAPAEAPRNGRELLAALGRINDVAVPAIATERKYANIGQQASPVDGLFAPGEGMRPEDDMRISATVRELALAYALNRDAHDLARGWLASRFAAQLAKPLWGELSLLLASDDRQSLNQLLDDIPDWLPMYDRVEAAQRAGRPALAKTLAFDQLAYLPHDEELHLRLTNMVTAEPASFQARITQIKEAPLHIRQAEVETGVNLMPGLKLTLVLTRRSQGSDDNAVLTGVPGRDNEVALTLRKRLETGFVSLTVQQRQAAKTTSGLRLDYSLSPMSHLSIGGRAGINQLATESAVLRAGAMRSGLETDFTYAISRAEYARLGLGWQRYASQAGTSLGSGHNWNLELGTHLRLEYPNLTLRAFATGNRFSDNGGRDAQIAKLVPDGVDPATFRFIPAGSVTYGLGLGIGTVVENNYTRAWRPFFELGFTYNSELGTGYNVRGGIVGSVLGQDMLMLRAQRSSSTPDISSGLQEIGLNYQWFY
jgi:polysaccharide biosynthesis protein PelB